MATDNNHDVSGEAGKSNIAMALFITGLILLPIHYFYLPIPDDRISQILPALYP